MSGSDDPLPIEAHETMERVLRDIQEQVRNLRYTLTKLENIGLFVPMEARFAQAEAVMADDADTTDHDQRRITSLIDALKAQPQAAPFDQITRILEDGWGQAVELWPKRADLRADSADQMINRAILIGALLDGLTEAINQSIH